MSWTKTHRGSRTRRRITAAGVLLLLASQQACYVYAPRPSAQLSAGRRYAFDITDRGRADLGPRLGPEVATIEGRLMAMTGEEYVLSISQISTFTTGSSHWSGERLALPRDYIGNVRERVFSRSRTITVASVAAGALVAFIVTRSLLGSGSGNDGGGEGPPPPNSLRR